MSVHIEFLVIEEFQYFYAYQKDIWDQFHESWIVLSTGYQLLQNCALFGITWIQTLLNDCWPKSILLSYYSHIYDV